MKLKKYTVKDKTFRSSFELYPVEMMTNYKISGEYKKIYTIKIKTIDREELEPDTVLHVELIGKNFRKEMIYIIEHQSYRTDKEKLKAIKKYLDGVKCKNKKPVHVYIITSVDPSKQERRYELTPSDIIEPEYIYISPEDIRKMLNNINHKIDNNEKLSDEEALQLVIALIFTPYQNEKEMVDEVFDILKREKTISGQIRVDIVDFLEHFNGETFDEKTRKELENMAANDIASRKRAMRMLFADELAEKDEENQKLKNKVKEKDEENQKLKNKVKENIKKLENIKDKNSPEAKKIIETLMLL